MAKDKIKKLNKEDEDNKWINFIDSNVKNHPIIRNFHPKMELAKNFYKGEQYKAMDEDTGNIYDVRVNRETRSKANLIKVFINVWASKMLAGNPIPKFSAHEGNTEDFDAEVAKVSQDLCLVLNKKEKFRKKNSVDVKNAGKVGWGIAKVYFDKKGGFNLSDALGIDSDMKSGEVKREVVNPIHFFPDPLGTSDEDIRWACHRFPMAISIVEDGFGLEKGSLVPDTKGEDRKDARNTTTVLNDYYQESEGTGNDIVFVNDLYLRATKEYPKGKHIVTVNKKVLINEDNPQGKDLPFVILKINADDDEIIGKSYAFDLIPQQRDFNKMNSIVMENAEWTGFNKMYQDRGNNYSDWTNDATGIIEGDSSTPPILLQAKPLPDYLVSGAMRIYETMQTVMNLHNVDFSQIPTRGTNSSGTVISELKESSRIAFASDIGAIKEFLEKINFKALKLYQQHFTVDELAKIVGKNKTPQLKKFMKVEFTPTSFDIEISIAEGFAQSPSAKFDQIMQLYRDGVFDSPHRDMIMQLIDNNANVASLTEDFLSDKKKAQYNLDLILEGKEEEIRVSQYDNFDIHKKIFIDYIKSYDWFEQSEETRLALDRYIMQMEMHKLANIQRQAELQTMQQQASQPPQPQMMSPQSPASPQAPAQPTAMDIQQTEENRHNGGVFADEMEQTPFMPPVQG